MLFRAPVSYVKSGRVTRKSSYLAVVMRHYPRYTPKELVDTYLPSLAPDPVLFKEFKSTEKSTGDHNQAFAAVDYEQRFTLSEGGWADLEKLATLAQTKSVYLLCQCGYEQRCHCDLLLIAARERFKAPVSQIPFSYPKFSNRLKVSD